MPAATAPTVIRLTEDGQFPITRTWRKTPAHSREIVSGDYRIRRSHDTTGPYAGYQVFCGQERIANTVRLAVAKVTVEKHAAGFGTFVAWYNMPEGK